MILCSPVIIESRCIQPELSMEPAVFEQIRVRIISAHFEISNETFALFDT